MASLYNEFRPGGWEEVIGQEGIVESLKNMVAEDKIVATLLFTGPRGTGKTTCARILAKAVNCESPKVPGMPCGVCGACKAVEQDESLNVFEIDSASRTGVDDMREVKSSTNLIGAEGKWKVYIFDECHMLSKSAQNSALKMFEEPPPKTIFILATTELYKMEGTIISRALMFNFRPVTIDKIVERLKYICSKKKIEYEEAALAIIAKVAQGGVRDSISILERVSLENLSKVKVSGVVNSLGITPTEVMIRLGEVIKGDHKVGLDIANEVISKGYDIHQFIISAIDYFRDLMMIKFDMGSMVKVEESMLKSMNSLSDVISQEQITNAIEILEGAIGKYKYTDNKQILLELALYRVADGIKEVANKTSESCNTTVVNNNVDMNTLKELVMSQILEFNRNVIKPSQPIQQPVQHVQNQVQQHVQESVRVEPIVVQQPVPENHVETDWEKINKNWVRFKNIVSGNFSGIGLTLEMSKPLSFNNNRLILGFNQDQSFFAEMFNMQMVNDVSKVLTECMGKICNVEAQVLGYVEPQTVVETPVEKKEVFRFNVEEPVVQQVQQVEIKKDLGDEEPANANMIQMMFGT
jgi:DNA polymerase III subunit gamma/tau